MNDESIRKILLLAFWFSKNYFQNSGLIFSTAQKSNFLKLEKERVTKNNKTKKCWFETEKSGDDKQANKLFQNTWDNNVGTEGKMMKAQYPRVCSLQKKVHMTFCSPHWRQHIRAERFSTCWHSALKPSFPFTIDDRSSRGFNSWEHSSQSHGNIFFMQQGALLSFKAVFLLIVEIETSEWEETSQS